MALTPFPHPNRILGIDPGLQRTGWGIIHQKNNQLSFIACGVIAPKASWCLADRLKFLHDGLCEVVTLHRPEAAAIEETFVNMNAVSTLKLGNARGALILSAAILGLPIHEYAATQVKKTVVGVGRAEKHQVEMMVKMLLPGCGQGGADAMDALAIAICHAHHDALGSAVKRVKP